MKSLRAALENHFSNKEINQSDNSLSGNIYVSMRDRSQTDGTLQKVFLSSIGRCGHQNRICAACAYSWGWDHQIYFERTGGGRRLKRQLIEHGEDPELIANGKGTKPKR